MFLALLLACTEPEPEPTPTPAEVLSERMAALAPVNFGHRGLGPTRATQPEYPENSLSAFVEAIERGADGIELDVGLTADGVLTVMHDDTMDRTTNCTGCVSELTEAEFLACRLLDGNGQVTTEAPPTLAQVFETLPIDAIVNIEIKVPELTCLDTESDPTVTAAEAVNLVTVLGHAERAMFSSLGEEAVEAVEALDPGLYSAYVAQFNLGSIVEDALDAGADALNPPYASDDATTADAVAAGLQVHVWNVDTQEKIEAALQMPFTGMITDEPGILADLKAR